MSTTDTLEGKKHMSTTDTPMLSKEEETRLWDRLHDHFVNARVIMDEIIAKKAWRASGYSSFAEAWADKMSDVTVPVDLRSAIVYQLLAEKLSREEITAVPPPADEPGLAWSRDDEPDESTGQPARLTHVGGSRLAGRHGHRRARPAVINAFRAPSR